MASNTETTSADLRITVTGLLPGTGSSTLSKSLAKFYDIPRAYGGQVRRALAASYTKYIEDSSPLTSERELWDAFVDLHISSGYQNGLSLLTNFMNSGSDVQLAAFNQTEQNHSEVSPFVTFPDYYMKSQLNHGSVILDGKLAVIIDQLRRPQEPELNQILEYIPNLAIPIIRIILDVDQRTSAQRTYLRENPEETLNSEVIRKEIAQNQQRIADDWESYSQTYTYAPTGEPIDLKHLPEQPHLIKINTSDMTPSQVEVLVLNHILGILEDSKPDSDGDSAPVSKLITQTQQRLEQFSKELA